MEEGGGGGLTAHDIYTLMTGGPGSSALDAAQQAASAEARLEDERAERVRRIAEKIDDGWQGASSYAAYSAAAPLVNLARDGADKLQRAQGLLDVESGVFNSMRNSVRPVPPTPPQSNVLNDMVPWETDLDRDIKKYQADAQHNMAVYGIFDKTSVSNERNLPREYLAIADSSGDISVRPPGAQSEGPPPGGGFRPGPGPVQPVDDAGGGPVTDSRPPNGGLPPNQETDPAQIVPSPVPPPGFQPPPGPQPPGPGPVTGWPGPGTPVPVGGRGPVRGFGPDGGRGVAGPGGRGGGPGGGRGAVVGGPGVRGGEPGVGGRPGADALAEEAAARRTGAAAGTRAAAGSGFAPVGAGRGPGGEDTEHERKYTIEPDPEELFGSDVRTVPQVIGEDEDDE